MKIFGIGLARTGNASLCAALNILGYNTIHFPRTIQEIESHAAAVDTSVAVGREFLDIMYPGSKFILTWRDEEHWLDSCERYWTKHHKNPDEFISKVHLALYGSVHFHRSVFIRAYRSYLNNVMDHFGGRRDDLLETNICGGDGWFTLCKFLGKPVPSVPFPHEHSWEKDMAANDK